ncbi:hypothetical protein AB5V95_01380 [Metamycoplasma spumans]|uniref:hypothetical protein n=1 Tax=Metamycoplasma spumans TaxID=92406 RepID=UPI0034DDC3BC
MPRNDKKKAVVGVLAGAALVATAGTIYVLIEDNHKANDARKEFAELVQKMKEWKAETRLAQKTYTSQLFRKFSDEIAKYENILKDENIKDFQKILDALEQAKSVFEDSKKEYQDLEEVNKDTTASIKSFNDLLNDYKTKNENNPLASQWIKKFESERSKLAKEYQRADNKPSLDKVKNRADELLKDLESTFKLTDQISIAKDINSKLPNDFKNKENLERAIADAEAILNNPLATQEEKKRTADELEAINKEFINAMNAERDNLTNQINDLIKDAENYKNTTLDYDKYRSLANKLGDEINELKSQMNNDNDAKTLKDILNKAKDLKPNASVIKNAIDDLNEKMPSAEKALKEIESAEELFASSNIKTELKNAIEAAKAAVNDLNKDDITSALATLNSKIEEANNLIDNKKDEIIAQTNDLIAKAKEESTKLEGQEEYQDKKEQLDDSTAKAEKNNKKETLLGNLVSNKNELSDLLTNTKKEVAKDKLSKEIAQAEKDLTFIKNNLVIDPSTEFEGLIAKAKETLENADAEGKDVDQIVNEYNEAARELKDKFLEKVKEATETKLTEAKQLSKDLEQEKYKVDNEYHPSKKDLDARITSTETTKDEPTSTSSNILEKLNELNNATKQAKRYKDADDEGRRKIIEEINALKETIASKKEDLAAAKDGLQTENTEKYKTLITELEKVLDDYENQVKPNVGDFGVARLEDVKTNLEKVIQSIPPKKQQIDEEFATLSAELAQLANKADELVNQMQTNEYNPEKEKLQELITKNQDPANKDSLEELRELVKEFKKANKAAEGKIASVNELKDAEIEKINSKISEITDFINANKDEYPEITNQLVEALKTVKDDNAPSYANTQAELTQKLNNITEALNNANEQLGNTQSKEALTLSTNQLEAVKDSITSTDPEMADLKSQLEAEIKKARDIIKNNETDKFVPEKQTVDSLKEEANEKIAAFEEKLKQAKNNFKKALEAAKTILETAKTADNTANYTNIISDIETKISQNDTIDENGALDLIKQKTDNLNAISDFYNTEKAKADEITNNALGELNKEIENAKAVKDTMLSEPDLNTAKETLEAAIESAKLAKEKSPKLANNKIEEAQNELKQAIAKAQEAIDSSNSQKTNIKNSINEKEKEIKDYINNELSNDPEYSTIKSDLETYLNNYVATDKNNLDAKTREQLENLLNQMSMQLQSAKDKKAEKDAEIAARNKAAMLKSKEALKTVSNSITSQDPKMTSLKSELDEAIEETNNIANNDQSDKYVEQKQKLDELKAKAERIKTDFATKLEEAKVNHADKLQKAKEKLKQLKADPDAANLTDVINKLEQDIAANENITDDEAISSIENKASSLEQAVTTATASSTENKKDRLKQLIDNIPYPDGALSSISTNTKESLKTTWVDDVVTDSTTREEIGVIEEKISALHEKVGSLLEKINSLPDGSAKDRLLGELAASDDTEITDLETKVQGYIDTLSLINSNFTHFTSSAGRDSNEHKQAVNSQIDNLKQTLKNKLAEVADDDLKNLKNLINKDNETVEALKTKFLGDILIAKNLIRELLTKNTADEAQTVKDEIEGIYRELRRFWGNEIQTGTFIRDSLKRREDYPSRASGILKPFENLRDDDVRSVTTADQLKNINDTLVPLYIKGIEFNKKLKAITANNMPDAVKQALRNKLLDQTDAAGMDRVTEYVAQPDNAKTTGWYLEALNTLNTIGTTTNNKSELLKELKNTDRSPGEDVLENIDTVRSKINEYKTAFEAAKTKLEEYSNNPNKSSEKYNELLTELNNIVTNKDKANDLKDKIVAAIELANKKAELKTLLSEVPFPNTNNAPAKITLTSDINALDSMDDANEMNDRLVALKEAIRTASASINGLPYPDRNAEAKGRIGNALNSATTADEVDNILPSTWASDLEEYKNIINGLTPGRQGIRDVRLNKTYPSSEASDSSVTDLRKQIIETYKVDIKEKITSITNMSESQKRPFIDAVEAVVSSNIATMDELKEKVDKIKNQYNLALQERFRLAKEAAKNALDSYKASPNKDNSKIQDLENRLNALTTVDHTNDAITLKNEIDGLIASANSLKAKKDDIKAVIGEIPYPNPESAEALEAKRQLAEEVDSLSTAEDLDRKLEEINALKNKMKEKVDLINDRHFAYEEGEGVPAYDTIKHHLNSAKTESYVSEAVPDDWSERLSLHKFEIDSFSNSSVDELSAFYTEMIKIFNQTVPDAISGATYTETELRKQIISKAQEAARNYVNREGNLRYLSAEDKNKILEKINNETLPENNEEQLFGKLAKITEHLNDAERANYNTFIDNLAYPSSTNQDDEINANSRNTKEAIKANLTSNISLIGSNTHLDTTLNNLARDIQALNTEISTVKPAAKQSEFILEFSRTDNEGIATLLQNVRNYKSDYDTKKREAQSAISQVNDQGKKSELERRLNNDSNTTKDLIDIKEEAIRERNNELDSARADANSFIETITYPGGTSSTAITKLKEKVNNANTIDKINELKEENKLIKQAVEDAVTEINKLSDNNAKKSQLRDELNRAIEIDGKNGIQEIKRKAIEAKKSEFDSKKEPLRAQIQSLKDSSDKKELLNKLNSATTDAELENVGNLLSLISRKEELKSRLSKLVLFDLKQPRNGLSAEEMKNLNKNITEATTSNQLDNIEALIEKQRVAEENDLAFETTNGGFVFEGDAFVYKDFSHMKKVLIDIIRKINVIKGNENSDSQALFRTEGQRLQDKITREVKTSEQYKRVLDEAEAFVARWDAGEIRNWLMFFEERAKSNSNNSPSDAGPFPVNVPENELNILLAYFKDANTTREMAVNKENEYLRTSYFRARRLKKLDYDYLQFINALKNNPYLDVNEKSRLGAQYDTFKRAISVEDKERIALSIDRSLTGNTNIESSWKVISQSKFVYWWVEKIANAPENIISQSNKYKWIDRITLNIDERHSLNRKLWDEFKQAHPDLLRGVQLNSAGYPVGHEPFFG